MGQFIFFILFMTALLAGIFVCFPSLHRIMNSVGFISDNSGHIPQKGNFKRTQQQKNSLNNLKDQYSLLQKDQDQQRINQKQARDEMQQIQDQQEQERIYQQHIQDQIERMKEQQGQNNR